MNTDRAGRHGSWSDEPIASADEDMLGRNQFAGRVLEVLAEVEVDRNSTVLGLLGPWGSGKTSTLNMIAEGLVGSRWSVTRVNPWAVSGADSVVREVLSAIASALPRDKSKGGEARRALQRYAAVAAPFLGYIPHVGGVMKDVVLAASRVSIKDTTLQAEGEAVAKALGELGMPFLIVVDDVDRLQPDELVGLFKAVRVLGRLPHVHYLLAYDERTVLDVLKETPIARQDEARALAFAEKIVSVRLDQPPTQPIQAAGLFNDGLSEVLEVLHMVLTEDQRTRLAEEYEGLLGQELSEPRTVSRFLTQVRAYLPLVGAEEVDFVDFVVLTLFRISRPRLYRAIAEDRQLLTGQRLSNSAAGELEGWADLGATLERLGVGSEDVGPVSTALKKVFPLLAARDGRLVWSREARARDRRASDPDHVERYFTFTPPAGDLADSVLVAGLEQLADGRGGDEARRVEAALRPNPSNERECLLAVRVLRRAKARTEDIESERAGALLVWLLGILPLPSTVAVGGPDDAAVSWLGQLMLRADGPLVGYIPEGSDADHRGTLIWLLARALRLADSPADLGSSSGASSRGRWLAELKEFVTEAAWEEFAKNVCMDDAAQLEPTGGLLRWVEEVRGAEDVNARLTGLVDKGAHIDSLSARLIELGTNPATGTMILKEFNPSDLLNRLGRRRVAADRDRLDQSAHGPTIDVTDISWKNRRRFSSKWLLEVLGDGERHALPAIPDDSSTALLNHRPQVFDSRSASDVPDLLMQCTFVLPGGGALPSADRGASNVDGDARETMFLAALQTSPLMTYLMSVRHNWNITDAGDWAVSGGDGRSVSSASLIPTSSTPADDRRGRPWILGSQLLSGFMQTGILSDLGPVRALSLTISVGLNIAELNERRQPDQERHNDVPLPASLDLSEAYSLMLAVVDCAESARRIFDGLGMGRVPASGSAQLLVEAPGGLGSVIDLSRVRRVPGTNSVRFVRGVTFEWKGSGRPWKPAANDFVASSLNDWLLEAGYREYQQVLMDQYLERLPLS